MSALRLTLINTTAKPDKPTGIGKTNHPKLVGQIVVFLPGIILAAIENLHDFLRPYIVPPNVGYVSIGAFFPRESQNPEPQTSKPPWNMALHHNTPFRCVWQLCIITLDRKGQCHLYGKDIGKAAAINLRCQVNGKLAWSTDGPNPVTWWVWKNAGICVDGPEISSLPFDVDTRSLVDFVYNNMQTYWRHRIKRNKKYAWLAGLLPGKYIDWEVQWCISGMLRQYYTWTENGIIGKTAACEYALPRMPSEWHKIVKEAISIRKGSDVRYYTSRKQRIGATIKCMEYLLERLT